MILKENVGEERSEDVLAIIIASRSVAPLHILPDDAEKVDTLVSSKISTKFSGVQ